jgi:Transglycosylase SLT domain
MGLGLQRRDLADRVAAGHLTQAQMDQELASSGAPAPAPPPPPVAATPPPTPPPAPAPAPAAGPAPPPAGGGVSPKYIAALKLEAAGQLAPDSQEAKALDTLRRAGQIPKLPTFSTDDPIWDATIKKYKLPADVFLGLAEHESAGFNPQAVSPTGVTGLLQVTKRTGAPYGLTHWNRTNPWLSVEIGGHYFRDLLDQTKGDVPKALRRWNVDDPNFLTSVLGKAAKYAHRLHVEPIMEPPPAAPGAPTTPPAGPVAGPIPPGATGVDELGLPTYDRPETLGARTTTTTTETLPQQWARRVGPFSSQEPGMLEIGGKILQGLGELYGTPVERLTGSPTAGDVASYVGPAATGLGTAALTRTLTKRATLRAAEQAVPRIAEEEALHAATQATARQVTARKLSRYAVDAVDAVRQRAGALAPGTLSPADQQLLQASLQQAATGATRAERLHALQVAERLTGGPIKEVRKLTTATARAGGQAAAAEERAARLVTQREAAARRLSSLQNPPPASLPRRLVKGGLRVGVRYGIVPGASIGLYKWLWPGR